jgi:hypothetical protein
MRGMHEREERDSTFSSTLSTIHNAIFCFRARAVSRKEHAIIRAPHD